METDSDSSTPNCKSWCWSSLLASRIKRIPIAVACRLLFKTEVEKQGGRVKNVNCLFLIRTYEEDRSLQGAPLVNNVVLCFFL